MSYIEYKQSQEIAQKNYDFYAIIMAAMRQAELSRRYHAPGGVLPEEGLKGLKS